MNEHENSTDDTLLRVRDLTVKFGTVNVLDSVTFEVKAGEVFGIVGESGSGKTMTALAILGLVPSPGKVARGAISLQGIDLLRLGERELRSIRGKRISIVWQDPSGALNPVYTAGAQMVEAIHAHQGDIGRASARALALDLFSRVHITDPARIFDNYPHQLSGGMKQRVLIAMALIHKPELIILDEPTTALDVTVQAGILNLLDEVIRVEKMSAIFISHDISVIARMCRTVAVMCKGKIVEMGRREQVLRSPASPYAAELLRAVRILS